MTQTAVEQAQPREPELPHVGRTRYAHLTEYLDTPPVSSIQTKEESDLLNGVQWVEHETQARNLSGLLFGAEIHHSDRPGELATATPLPHYSEHAEVLRAILCNENAKLESLRPEEAFFLCRHALRVLSNPKVVELLHSNFPDAKDHEPEALVEPDTVPSEAAPVVEPITDGLVHTMSVVFGDLCETAHTERRKQLVSWLEANDVFPGGTPEAILQWAEELPKSLSGITYFEASPSRIDDLIERGLLFAKLPLDEQVSLARAVLQKVFKFDEVELEEVAPEVAKGSVPEVKPESEKAGEADLLESLATRMRARFLGAAVETLHYYEGLLGQQVRNLKRMQLKELLIEKKVYEGELPKQVTDLLEPALGGKQDADHLAREIRELTLVAAFLRDAASIEPEIRKTLVQNLFDRSKGWNEARIILKDLFVAETGKHELRAMIAKVRAAKPESANETNPAVQAQVYELRSQFAETLNRFREHFPDLARTMHEHKWGERLKLSPRFAANADLLLEPLEPSAIVDQVESLIPEPRSKADLLLLANFFLMKLKPDSYYIDRLIGYVVAAGIDEDRVAQFYRERTSPQAEAALTLPLFESVGDRVKGPEFDPTSPMDNVGVLQKQLVELLGPQEESKKSGFARDFKTTTTLEIGFHLLGLADPTVKVEIDGGHAPTWRLYY